MLLNLTEWAQIIILSRNLLKNHHHLKLHPRRKQYIQCRLSSAQVNTRARARLSPLKMNNPTEIEKILELHLSKIHLRSLLLLKKPAHSKHTGPKYPSVKRAKSKKMKAEQMLVCIRLKAKIETTQMEGKKESKLLSRMNQSISKNRSGLVVASHRKNLKRVHLVEM